MISLRQLGALACLAASLPLFAACDSWPIRSNYNPTAPLALAVTAPDLAPPGSDVMVRVHWAGVDCGTRFVRFDIEQDREGTWVLYPRWSLPDEPPGCLPYDATAAGLEQIQRLVMPASGPLRFRINVGGEALAREVLPGVPAPERVFRLSVLTFPGARPRGAVSVDLYPIYFINEDGSSFAVGDPVPLGETDSTGILDIDLGILDSDQPWLFLARDPVARTSRVLALLAAPTAGLPAEHMMLISEEASGSVAPGTGNSLLFGITQAP